MQLLLSKLLALEGNEVRLKILFLLEEEKELCRCNIADILEMSITAISQHLRKMKDGNVLQTRCSGQTIYYSLKAEHHQLLKPLFKIINTTKHLCDENNKQLKKKLFLQE